MKLIINVDDETVHPSRALEAVSKVIGQGKISEASGVPHFCWVSKFEDGVMVATRLKKKGQIAETFSVYRGEEDS